jgi:hypothetical protein
MEGAVSARLPEGGPLSSYPWPCPATSGLGRRPLPLELHALSFFFSCIFHALSGGICFLLVAEFYCISLTRILIRNYSMFVCLVADD